MHRIKPEKPADSEDFRNESKERRSQNRSEASLLYFYRLKGLFFFWVLPEKDMRISANMINLRFWRLLVCDFLQFLL